MTIGRPAEAGLLRSGARLLVSIDGQEVAVNLVRSARRRRTISFSVAAGEVVVRSPLLTPRAFIVEALERRSAWIAARLREQGTQTANIADGARVPFLGGWLRLDVRESASAVRSRVVQEGDTLVITLGTGRLVAAQPVRHLVERWYRSIAAELLPEMTRNLAGRVGHQPAKVLVRGQRTRWGSCSADGVIRLNWRLVLLDRQLAEYVILHELTHLEHRHHRAAFWEALEAVAPGSRRLRARLVAEGRLAMAF